jgi:hypothetical protein
MSNPPETATNPSLPELSAIELEQYVSLGRAAELFDIHIETFEATYPHLIKRVSPRCRRVRLRDLISEQSGKAAAGKAAELKDVAN